MMSAFRRSSSATRSTFQAFPYPLGMRSGPTVELVTESGDSRPRMWPLTQAPPTVLRSSRSHRTEAGSLLLLYRVLSPRLTYPCAHNKPFGASSDRVDENSCKDLHTIRRRESLYCSPCRSVPGPGSIPSRHNFEGRETSTCHHRLGRGPRVPALRAVRAGVCVGYAAAVVPLRLKVPPRRLGRVTASPYRSYPSGRATAALLHSSTGSSLIRSPRRRARAVSAALRGRAPWL